VNDNVAWFSSGEVVNWPNPPEEWPFYDTYPSTYVKPDFSAPGVDITSAVPGGGYEAWSGTSMATPHVALIIQAMGVLDFNFQDLPETVYEILNSTSVDLGDPGQDIRYGWGRIDAYEAVLKAQEYAKTTGVEGHVYDAVDHQPVTWASVTVLEVNKTVSVNEEGYFKIPLDPGNYTLLIEAWGYQPQTIQIGLQRGQSDVGGNGHRQHQAQLASIFAHISNP
jgi:subtilisin family serine protease